MITYTFTNQESTGRFEVTYSYTTQASAGIGFSFFSKKNYIT